MSFWVIGLSHKTAPVAIRERAAILPHVCHSALQEFMSIPTVEEAIILSTCNRTEFYFYTAGHVTQVITWLQHYLQLPHQFLSTYCYQYQDAEAIEHLIAVASGLDSMVMGEPQVLGQFKEAYQCAVETGTVGSQLNHLMQFIFSVSKHIRSETDIGKRSVSVASVAMDVIKEWYSDLSELEVLLIGSGNTIATTARYFHDHQVKALTIANRTTDHAHVLANAVNARVISINEIPWQVKQHDLIVSATACPYPILTHDIMATVGATSQRQQVLMDLAVPRDIEESVAQLPNIKLFCLDDLQQRIQENKLSREHAANIAKEIIQQRVQEYLEWNRSLETVATIRAYRQRLETLRDREIEQALRLIAQGKNSENIIRNLAYNLTNKFLHTPTTRLRDSEQLGEMNLLAAASHLFDLDTTTH
ncbi:MAG: glutamyl-tRNA reductase [Legionellales bacterium]|nr:glutamyl-tRNA reductase [Legionellales bacterium]